MKSRNKILTIDSSDEEHFFIEEEKIQKELLIFGGNLWLWCVSLNLIPVL